MNEGRLARYLERIGHGWNVRPDLETLRSLHRAHLAAIPFENLDVQLGEVPALEPDAVFNKLVERRRGGWCYEMNGLFGWALEAIGFRVTRLSCGVMREARGEEAMGSHLALLVECGGTWLADVGFGGSLAEPLPLAEGGRDDLPFTVGLERIADDHWRFVERRESEPFSFDFRAVPADEVLLLAMRDRQATHPESPFTLNFVAQKRIGERHLSLRGRVLTDHSASGPERRLIADEAEFAAALDDLFGIEEPRAREIWPAVCDRHEALFAGEAV